MSILRQSSYLQNCFSIRCLQFSSILFNYTPTLRHCSKLSAHCGDSKNKILQINQLPNYNKINSKVVQDTIPALVDDVKKNYKQFESNLTRQSKNVAWDDIFPVAERITDELSLTWSAVSHLISVKNNQSLRDVFEKMQPDVVSLFNTISQSKTVYHAIEELSLSADLDEAQSRIISSALKSARNSGVHLEGTAKDEFNKIVQRLAELSTKFTNNVLDSSKEFSYIIYDKADMAGVPLSLRSLMATTCAKKLNKTIDPEVGPWQLSLDLPCFQPFIKNSLNTVLREKIYMAYITRASTGTFTNSHVIEEIRTLRKQRAKLLGFNTYADLSLDSKMAKSPKAVWQLINDLKDKSKTAALKEVQELQEFATKHGYIGELKQWDIPFWSERQREKLFNLNEEKLKEYFPFSKVLDGLFALSKELFAINILECSDGVVDTWNSDVKFFKIYNNDGNHIASFFLDAFSRPNEKNGGAWMDSALDKNDALHRKPVAYLVCNQSPPVGKKPSLLTFNEVETLFHEFGHGLQHMLTTVKYPSAAGINNVEWDAVELPSQFMENWLYDWYTIQKVSAHYQTNEILPREMFDQLVKARQYQAGLLNVRQAYFSAIDMALHSRTEDWRTLMEETAKDYLVIKPLTQDAFPCSFKHIFGGGYAAGYYSYKWAEVLSADAFSLFNETGLENRSLMKQLGRKFRDTILSEGGSKHPEKIYLEFRGREANVDALMKSYGLQ